MSEPAKNPFDLLLEQIRAVVRSEIDKALAEQKPAKLLFDTGEAAAMLNVPDTWLAAKAGAGEVPYRQAGHYRYFSMQDINQIIAQFRVDPRSISMIYAGHDGKEFQADSAETRVEPIGTRETSGCVAEHGRSLGQGREADPDNGRTRDESPSRKTRERGKD